MGDRTGRRVVWHGRAAMGMPDGTVVMYPVTMQADAYTLGKVSRVVFCDAHGMRMRLTRCWLALQCCMTEDEGQGAEVESLYSAPSSTRDALLGGK